MDNLTVTSLSELQAYTQGQLVELPSFADGMPFVARLRRPSMLVLTKNGKIPNELLQAANELFTGSPNKRAIKDPDDNTMARMFDVFEILCEASFVEPTYQQIKDIGLELTDEQMVFIFNYSQSGVKALKSFRTEQSNSGSDSTKQNVQQDSK